jgi:hypothetical protein
MANFDLVFRDFLTAESGSLNPRDDLIAYLATDECKKPRKINVRSHANRIETLCLYANRLEGVKAILTDVERISSRTRESGEFWPICDPGILYHQEGGSGCFRRAKQKRKKEDREKDGNGKGKPGKKQRTSGRIEIQKENKGDDQPELRVGCSRCK